jgi:hypothetical protein
MLVKVGRSNRHLHEAIRIFVFVVETEYVLCGVGTDKRRSNAPPDALCLQVHVLRTECVCVLHGSQVKQRLFPLMELTDWLL